MNNHQRQNHPYALPIGWLILVSIWALIGLWGLGSIDAANLAYLLFWLHYAALIAPSLTRLLQLLKQSKKLEHHEAT